VGLCHVIGHRCRRRRFLWRPIPPPLPPPPAAAAAAGAGAGCWGGQRRPGHSCGWQLRTGVGRPTGGPLGLAPALTPPGFALQWRRRRGLGGHVAAAPVQLRGLRRGDERAPLWGTMVSCSGQLRIVAAWAHPPLWCQQQQRRQRRRPAPALRKRQRRCTGSACPRAPLAFLCWRRCWQHRGRAVPALGRHGQLRTWRWWPPAHWQPP
jgi:hypothetical protein